MNYLFVSYKSDSIGIATHLVMQGNNVFFFCLRKECCVDNGIVPIIGTYRDKIEWADIIMFDYSVFGDEPLAIRKKFPKKIVVGGCDMTDKLESNKDFGLRMLNLFSVKSQKHFNFTSKEDSIKFIKKFPNQYLIELKVNGKSVILTTTDKTSQDLIILLSSFDYIGDVTVFEKIAGVEISITSFFDGIKFIDPIISFEHKNVGNDDIGLKMDSSMGNVFFQCTKNCKLYKETLGAMELFLKDKYFGFVSLDIIVNTAGSYVLRIIPRFNYPLILSLSTIFGNDWVEFLTQKNYKLNNEFGISVSLFLMDIGISNRINNYKNMPIIGLNDTETIESFQPNKVVFKDYFRYNGDYIGDIALSAKTIYESQVNIYNLIDKINIPKIVFYRVDIGNKTMNQYRWLRGQKVL